MSSLADSQLLAPKSWDSFEEMCADLFEREWQYPNTERYGRQGQRQNGVDIYGKTGADHVGVQCKGKTRWPPKKLTVDEINTEVARALKFEPKLRQLVFATTTDNDVVIQDHVHSLTEEHEKSGLFSVHVYWWSEITRRLTRHEDLIRKHFGYAQLGELEQKIDAISEQTSKISFPASSGIIDREIRLQRDILRKARFFGGFNSREASETYASRVLNGDLQSGSHLERASILCWCARLLAFSNAARAREFLSIADSYGLNNTERQIVDAFLTSAEGNSATALRRLAEFDLPATKSAAFFIASKDRNAVEALTWLSQVCYSPIDLDSDGKFHFVTKCFDAKEWATAVRAVESFTNEDFDETPALLFVAAMAHLLQGVPEEFRRLVRQQVPFELESFPLSTTSEMLEHYLKAKAYFHACASAAERLQMNTAADMAADYALWLDLLNPKNRESALEELRISLTDPRHSLRRLNFAIRFGLDVDIEKATREIDRQTTLTGGESNDAAFARFALAFKLSSAADFAEYLSLHREQLVKNLDSASLTRLEIEMLCRSGQVTLAQTRLADVSRESIDQSMRLSLERIISEARGSDPIAGRISEYERDPSLSSLTNLINLLEKREDWQMVERYSRLLLSAVTSVDSAKRLARALNELGKNNEIYLLLSNHPEFVSQSDVLKFFWCVCLFENGDLHAASNVLTELRAGEDHADYRNMEVQIAISSGNWETLTIHLEAEWSAREKRNAQELIALAQLAQIVQSPRARGYAQLAVSKANENPRILLTAFEIATKSGWEEDDEVGSWLRGAIEKSGEDGPIQRMSLNDVLDRRPAWDERGEDSWNALKNGEVPIFGAAESIHKTLCDLYLIPALLNVAEVDARKRSHIFAYSGATSRDKPKIQNISLDATALLTAAILDITEMIIDTFEDVIIPHATLGWLFEEKHRIKFYQPSRIRVAMELRTLLHDDKLRTLIPTENVDADLSADVGYELASLLAEAKLDAEASERQRLVVRSYPVHQIGSLMTDTVNLETYSNHLCSCLGVIEKLWQKGHLTASQRERACLYLKRNEQSWPSEPLISDGAILYLDSLAVNYLHHLGVMSKLKDAGFEVFISQNESKEINDIIKYGYIIEKSGNILEKLRQSLARGIASNKVKLGPFPSAETGDRDRFRSHPTVSVLDTSPLSDVVVVDDRFVNQHRHVDVGGRLVPIITSAELLAHLADMGVINFSQLLEYRTTLRKSGFTFLSLSDEELKQHIMFADVVDGQLQETADLKAIREMILQNRMSAALVQAKEIWWLAELQKSIAKTLREQWISGDNVDEIVARSNWLLQLLDLRGWSKRSDIEEDWSLAHSGRFTLVLSLLRPPPEADDETALAYWDWLTQTVLDPLKERDPEMFEQIVDATEATIIHVVGMSSEDAIDEE